MSSPASPLESSSVETGVEAALVAGGGALGALSRAAVAWLLAPLGLPEAAATQSVNLAGALALGLLIAWLEAQGPRPRWRAFLAVGVLGSFTTFSTLVAESLNGAPERSSAVGLAVISASLALGIAAYALAKRAGDRLFAACGRSPSQASEEVVAAARSGRSDAP